MDGIRAYPVALEELSAECRNSQSLQVWKQAGNSH